MVEELPAMQTKIITIIYQEGLDGKRWLIKSMRGSNMKDLRAWRIYVYASPAKLVVDPVALNK